MVRGLLCALAALLLLLPVGCQRLNPHRSTTPASPPLSPQGPSGRLQEVAPPAAVQQLQATLADHIPQITIVEPRDGTTLGPGSTRLRLQVRDWPLVDAGPLGLGPHVVVQLDDQPPLRLTSPQAGPAASGLQVDLPPLSPGSHRITAYAARPWGEAVKIPGAWDQVRVHRVAANPLAIPQPGTPQLIPVSPGDLSSRQPVLLDWLLLDAPLQGLRDNDGSWRLRVTVNGDSFLVDQNAPLWLKGWQNGSNSLVLELVDGQGEPLNPPFNTVVQELLLDTAEPQPIWQRGPLEANTLEQLLGKQPPPPAEEPAAIPPPEAPAKADPPIEVGPPSTTAESPAAPPANPQPAPDLEPPKPAAEPAEPQPQHSPARPMPTPAPTATPPSATAERIAPSTSLQGSARAQVNPDGSLLKPQPKGPLAGLRQKLGT